MAKKINWPIGIAEMAELTGKKIRTLRDHCQKLGIPRLGRRPYKISEIDYDRILDDMANTTAGNPNFLKKN